MVFGFEVVGDGVVYGFFVYGYGWLFLWGVVLCLGVSVYKGVGRVEFMFEGEDGSGV